MPYIGQIPSTGENNNFKILDDILSYTETFNGSSSGVVSVADDTLTFVSHRFITGQRITYSTTGTAIGGLVISTAYFVIKNDQNTIKLASTFANANNNVAINLTALGTGTTHTINVAFDSINTKFKATFDNGTKALITRAGQLQISINGVIQQPQDTTSPTNGFGIDLDGVIIFSTAPANTDIFWGNVFANNFATFDISDNTVDSFTGTGSLTAFTLSKEPANSQNLLVTIDGVVQYPNDANVTRAYSVVSNVLTFEGAPGNGTDIQVRHIGFAGATSSSVTGFYGRTGNVGLTTADTVSIGAATIGTGGIGTSLLVQGNARITGILTVGTGSITIDGVNNTISGVINTNATGVSTVGSLSIGNTSVISSARQLQNIASLDATTTATIESAVANAPNTFTDLSVSGISTLGVTSATNLTAQSLNVSGIITATQLSTGASGTGVNISTDTISGPATLTIDPAAVGDNTGAVRIKGDLYVDGTQFIVNSTTIELADFNVGIASTVGTNALLDGAGIGIGSIGIRKTLTWNNSSTALKSSEDFDISSGKVYRVNGTSVLSNNTLGSGVVTSSLTSVGTLGQLQVTGISTFSNGPVFIGTASSTGTASQPLQVTGGAYVSGSVGIGTINPLDPLHLQGIFRIDRQLSAQDQTYIRYFRQGTEKARFGLLAADNAIFFNATATDSANHLVINSSGNVLVGSSSATGTASQPLQVTGGAYVSGNVGIGLTNPLTKLDVRGVITAGADATSGSEIIRGYYSGGGSLNVIGSEYSSGGLVLGSSVKPSTSASSAFFSSTGISISRGAYTIAGYEHRWYVGAVQTVAENSSVTMSEVMRINASGNLGIGTITPRTKLDVAGGGYFTGFSNPTDSGRAGLEIGYDGSQGVVQCYDRPNGVFKNIQYQATQHIFLGGNIKVGSGYGIDFSAASNAAGMTSELLADYEEGTWTPVWESSGTLPTLSYATQSGHYIKIGGVVHFWGRIYMSSWGGGGGSGNIRVGGLPFTSSNVANTHKPLCQVTFSYNGGNAVWPSGATQVFAEVINSSTSLQYICLGAPTTQLGDSAPLQWTSNPQMYNNYFSGSYFV